MTRSLPRRSLDRLLHHSTTINIRGESYRLKDRRKAGLVPPRGQEGAEATAGSMASDSVAPKTRQRTAEHLSIAVERDPEFALAHSTLSYVCTQINHEFDPLHAWLEKAEHHCHVALMLDPALPEGHSARAFILRSPAKNFQHADAIAALEQVLAAQPNIMSGPP